jgi:D-alanyl-D-alanine carboxypeptidase
MDKLLRNVSKSEEYADTTSEYFNKQGDEVYEVDEENNIGEKNINSPTFAYLGSPRDRHHTEHVPSVNIPAKKKIKMNIPHFRLVSDSSNFKEANMVTYVKYGALALFIGVSVMSFLTQGVLAVKDMVFGPTERATMATATETVSQSTTILGTSTELEALGSDDSQSGQETGDSLNQYQLDNASNLPNMSSRAFLAADLQTGEIILERNEGLIAPIASVTKLMTAVVAKENIDMQKIAIVSRDSYNTYGTQGELRLGEKIKVYDLMYPLLMESSNDAAEVIADAYDKGHEEFMVLMNKKAVELGMTDTYYEDPSGLNPKNVSSIRDLLKLGRYIYEKHPELYSMTRVRQYAILKHTWFNQNRFLNYDTFLGGKNGYIDEAKKTTVSLFDVTMAKGGKRPVVVVILRSDDREGDAVKIINFLKKNAYFSVAN